MELDFLLSKNRYHIIQTLKNMFLGIYIVIATITILILTLIPSPYDIFLILFVHLLAIVNIIEEYIMQEIEKRLDFEEGIETYRRTGAIPYELFHNITKPVNRDNFHICRELNNQGNISKWSIYRKDMSTEDYFSKENNAILTEKGGLLSLFFFANKSKLDRLIKQSSCSTRTLLYCQERINYVENVINKLNSFEKEVFELIFKENCDFTYCEQMKHINKNTYYNIYNKSIYYLAQEFGII